MSRGWCGLVAGVGKHWLRRGGRGEEGREDDAWAVMQGLAVSLIAPVPRFCTVC